MKVLILGFGPHASGADAAEYYKSYGNDVTLDDFGSIESSKSLIMRMEKIGVPVISSLSSDEEISKYDIVVKASNAPISQRMRRLCNEITNDLAALFKDPRTKKMKKIIIVGSKGKTNIASAVSHALNLMGYRAVTCGSLGMSGFNILQDINEKGEDIYTHLVIEMTNWQISDTSYALYHLWPEIDIVLLTKKADERKSEKKETYQIFGSFINKALINKNAKDTFLKQIKGQKPRKIIYTPTSFNPYRNTEPLESAYEVLKALGYHKKDILKALSSYRGIPHRMEQVAFKNSILYINDSAATLPEAVAFTFKMIGAASIHLITGGTDKNSEIDVTGMKMPLKMATSITLLSGSFTDKLISYMEKNNIKYSGPFEDLRDAVYNAKEKAEENLKRGSNSQIVLLAPASTSQDYFENEFDRGDKFKEIVKEITSANA